MTAFPSPVKFLPSSTSIPVLVVPPSPSLLLVVASGAAELVDPISKPQSHSPSGVFSPSQVTSQSGHLLLDEAISLVVAFLPFSIVPSISFVVAKFVEFVGISTEFKVVNSAKGIGLDEVDSEWIDSNGSEVFGWDVED